MNLIDAATTRSTAALLLMSKKHCDVISLSVLHSDMSVGEAYAALALSSEREERRRGWRT